MINNTARGDDILSEVRPGAGLFQVTEPDGHTFITNVRRIAGKGREKKSPGTYPIWSATWLLTAIGLAALFVSFSAQRQYIFNVRHQSTVSLVEAGLPDLLLAVVTLLALGLSLAGKSSRTERVLILACAAASAFMNVSDDASRSLGSIFAFVLGPAVFAVAVDRVVTVIRRHRLGDSETSPWTALGHGMLACAKFSALIMLYLLRTALAPRETVSGIRRMVLDAAPVPGAVIVVPAIEHQEEQEPEGLTQRDRDELCLDERQDGAKDRKETFLYRYRQHPGYEDPAAALRVGALAAGTCELRPGTGRAYALQEQARLAQSREREDRCQVRFSDTTGDCCSHVRPCMYHDGPFPTKKEAFLAAYRRHPEYGVRPWRPGSPPRSPLWSASARDGRTYAMRSWTGWRLPLPWEIGTGAAS